MVEGVSTLACVVDRTGDREDRGVGSRGADGGTEDEADEGVAVVE